MDATSNCCPAAVARIKRKVAVRMMEYDGTAAKRFLRC